MSAHKSVSKLASASAAEEASPYGDPAEARLVSKLASASAAEEALQDVAYVHDGTIEGLLTAVFQSYANREVPLDVITADNLQLRLGQSVRFIETDFELAQRVKRGIERAGGNAAFDAVVRASLADDPAAGTIVATFIRLLMERRRAGVPSRSILDERADPRIDALVTLERHVTNEAEKMRQFVRFSHLENGVWFARCNPNASVVPLIMGYFAARLNTQPFIIYDENHLLAGVYGGSDWSLVRGEAGVLPSNTAEDALAEELWRRFYDAVTIGARYHPELRRQFMPQRLWKNLPEMKPRRPTRISL